MSRRPAAAQAAYAVSVLLLCGCTSPGAEAPATVPPGSSAPSASAGTATGSGEPSSASAPGAAFPTAVPSATGPAATGQARPSPAAGFPSAAPIDQDNWKTYSSARAGLAFDYPSTWTVVLEEDADAEPHPFVVLGIVDARGNKIASVHSYVATDTDGDMGFYSRTVLDEAAVPGLAPVGQDAKVYLEYAEITGREDPAQPVERTARMFIADSGGYDPAGTGAELQTFSYPGAERSGWFYTEPGFFSGTPVDAGEPTVDQLRKFGATERFQAMKQIMLSLRPPA